MNVTAPVNYFSALWLRGFKNILPIIPPGSTLSSSSSVPAAKIGKIPGKKKAGGWVGFGGWQNHVTLEAELAEWFGWGAGVGIRCDNGLVAIDTDPDEPADATIIKACVAECLGSPPTRIGQDPRALFVCRTDPNFTHPKVLFRERAAVDILTQNGHQFIAAGLHPRTIAPYRWTVPLVAFDQIPVTAPERLEELFETLKNRLPKGRFAVAKASTSGVAPPQEQLRGRLEDVKRAVEAIPNNYADRDMYIWMAFAIRAALPDDIETGADIFWEWCDRWKDPEGNDEERVRKEFLALRPPFRCGASWLYETAQMLAPDKFDMRTVATTWAQVVEPVLAGQATGSSDDMEIVNAASLADLPIPVQKWLVKDMIPEGNVSLLGGDGGTGKSLLALQLAIAKATGGEWLGHEFEPGRVLYLSAEDELDELHRRSKTLCPNMHALDMLDFAPMAGKDAVLAAPEGKEGRLRATKVFAALQRRVEALRPSLLILDTQADLFGGDEIKKIHAQGFISMLRGVSLSLGPTILLLYHPSISGMTSGTGTSGNVGWGNSVRSRLYLYRKTDSKGVEIDSDERQLEVKKANRAASGLMVPLRYQAGRFIRQGAIGAPGEVAFDAERIFLELLDQMEREGRPVSAKRTARNYAPAVFAQHHRAGGMGAQHFSRAMDKLFEQVVIEIGSYRKDSKDFDKIRRCKLQPEVGDGDLFT